METDNRASVLASQAISVKELNNYIKKMFAADYLLKKVCVKGEVSNLKYHSSGHIYFSLKDGDGLISCIMFAGNRRNLNFRLEEGMQVIVQGSVDIFEAAGKYQLYAREIVRDGLGTLYERFIQLKNKLEEMGMFASEYKKPVPDNASRVGIVTSPTGAAIRDIESVSRSRNPYVELILYPALVQGDGAAHSIALGIRKLNELKPDVIIVGRGGGSIEDLWAFNEEEVAEAIFQSEVPIVSAVGHETDFTISDFVADLRVPTPTAAAQRVVGNINELQTSLKLFEARLTNDMLNILNTNRQYISTSSRHLNLLRPESLIRSRRENLIGKYDRINELMRQRINRTYDLLDYNKQRITSSWDRKLNDTINQYRVIHTRMKGLNPVTRLEQGFSYTRDSKGQTLKSIDQVEINNMIEVYVSDGIITGTVTDKRSENYV